MVGIPYQNDLELSDYCICAGYVLCGVLFVLYSKLFRCLLLAR